MMNDLKEGAETRMSFWAALSAGCGTPEDRKNQLAFVCWSVVWVLTLAAAVFYLENNPEFQDPAAWAVASIPIVLSIGIVFAFLRFLRNADEFIQKIQIEGLAVGFGTGVVFGIGYRILERVGAPEMSASDLVVVMTIGWMAGQIAGVWRYR